ncbi:MAG: hypothetical protein WC796_02090 [Candidatus Pacearchaeota archaeon]|jgi:hypothetical protein
MTIKKGVFFGMSFVFLLFISLFSVSAIDVVGSFDSVNKIILNDHTRPAVFNLKITNFGPEGDFEIYIFEKFNLNISAIHLKTGETKTYVLQMYPLNPLNGNSGYLSVPIYIRDKNNPMDEEKLVDVVVKLVNFKSTFKINFDSVNLDSTSEGVTIYNLDDLSYSEIQFVFSSAFFDETKQSFDLKPYDKREFEIPINKEKLKSIVAGNYTVDVAFSFEGKNEKVGIPVQIFEKSEISENQKSSGIIVRRDVFEKTNEGNVVTVTKIEVRKNIISRLFASFSTDPDKVERKNFFVYYTWQRVLNPTEKLSVAVTTNWAFPFIIAVLIIVIGFLVNLFLRQDLMIHKKVSYVKTKTNDFALKVIITVKSRKFMSNVKIYDRLPGIAKLYEHFGVPPEQKDASGRLQWSIDRLAPGEERIFSYILYSKINVVGKFELPPVLAVYESNGKMGNAKSNRVLFINEPKRDADFKEE